MRTAKPIRVIIADDHDLFRDGLRLLLSQDPGIELVGEAADGKQLVEMARKLHPAVILTDLRMPVMDGIAAIKEIIKTDPSIQSIALSTFDSESLIVEALEAGAMGYIIKNAQRGEIVEAIKTVNYSSPYYCNSTSRHLIKMISKSKFNPYLKKNNLLFSDREKDIIRMICKEYTSKDIGQELFMSTRTVEGYRTKILEKMNVRSPAGIAIFAIKNFIYKLDA